MASPTPLMRPAPVADASTAERSVFNGLLLAVVGGRRLSALIGPDTAGRTGLLARLARHLTAEGMFVLTVSAMPGSGVEDLIDAAGRARLPRGAADLPFDPLVEALERDLDAAGAGILMVDHAERLDAATLHDLQDLATSTTPGGRALQILVAGEADLEPLLAAVGIGGPGDGSAPVHRLIKQPPPDRTPVAPRHRRPAPEPAEAKEQASGIGWFGVALVALAASVLLILTGAVDPVAIRETLTDAVQERTSRLWSGDKSAPPQPAPPVPDRTGPPADTALPEPTASVPLPAPADILPGPDEAPPTRTLPPSDPVEPTPNAGRAPRRRRPAPRRPAAGRLRSGT